jgi:predicted GH43/DUF377 family glycosyl hydrolase
VRQGQLTKVGGGNILSHGVLSDPAVLHLYGFYHMWYTAAWKPYTPQQKIGIAYASSPDGMVWTPLLDLEGEALLLIAPTPGTFDAGGVETSAVLQSPDSTYAAFYTGISASDVHSIGLATSPDGLLWTKVGQVLAGRAGKWDAVVSEPSVIVDGALLKMWFVGLGVKQGKTAWRIGYATSTDGVNWSRNNNPVFEPVANGWDDLVCSHVNVVKLADGYHMLYFGSSAAFYAYGESSGGVMTPGCIGHAWSPDGLVWTRDANPVINLIAGSAWEAWQVGGPCCILVNGQRKIWYFGSSVHDSYEMHMGCAIA